MRQRLSTLKRDREDFTTLWERFAGRPTDDGAAALGTDAVYVVHTSLDDTLRAVSVAADFAEPLGVPVTLVHVRAVPYALPIDAPTGVSAVETEAFEERLRKDGFDVRLRVFLCRDERQALLRAFERPALIVVAGHRSWWPTVAQRWQRTLEAAGHLVVFVNTGGRAVSKTSASSLDPTPHTVNEETSHA